MYEELSALQLNQTWILTPLPAGQKPIGCKWVYKIKYNSDGSVDKYKTRLIAKGYTQIEGVDYSKKISPTTKLTTLRCLSRPRQTTLYSQEKITIIYCPFDLCGRYSFDRK